VGRIAVTCAWLITAWIVALAACSPRVVAVTPAADAVARTVVEAVAAPVRSDPPRGAAAVAPRAASPAQRGFPFGERRAEWIPATPWNYDRGRFGERVEFIVIHYTAISYERTLRAFTSPASGVSAHYVVRHDGQVTQMVSEDDTAWQAGNYWFNLRSVGIEIELAPGESNDAFTAEQYYAAASLACGVAARHGVALDRAHVVGHNEIPGPGKIDPGPTWGWPHFMYLTSLCAPPTSSGLHARFVDQSPYPEVDPGGIGTVSVVLENTGAVAWRKGESTEVRLGIPGNDPRLAFLGAGWPTPARPAVQAEDLVPPGGRATFKFSVTGELPGSYLIPLRPVVDGVTWLEDQGMHTVLKVRD